jgi:hypothetical protein
MTNKEIAEAFVVHPATICRSLGLGAYAKPNMEGEVRPMKIARTSRPRRGAGLVAGGSGDLSLINLPVEAFDERIAIVGTAGSGKTYAAKGFVERLFDSSARVVIVDPLGVWWGLRASADGSAPGYPVTVLGGKHVDVPIISDMGVALGRIVTREALASSSTYLISVAALPAGVSRRLSPRRFTRRMRSQRISSSTTRICGRRRGRSKAGRASLAISRRSLVAAACAASSRG